jgi:hypothetical protein
MADFLFKIMASGVKTKRVHAATHWVCLVFSAETISENTFSFRRNRFKDFVWKARDFNILTEHEIGRAILFFFFQRPISSCQKTVGNEVC